MLHLNIRLFKNWNYVEYFLSLDFYFSTLIGWAICIYSAKTNKQFRLSEMRGMFRPSILGQLLVEDTFAGHQRL